SGELKTDSCPYPLFTRLNFAKVDPMSGDAAKSATPTYSFATPVHSVRAAIQTIPRAVIAESPTVSSILGDTEPDPQNVALRAKSSNPAVATALASHVSRQQIQPTEDHI